MYHCMCAMLTWQAVAMHGGSCRCLPGYPRACPERVVSVRRSMYDSVRAALTGTQNAGLRLPSPRAAARPPPPHGLLHSLATWKWSA